MQFQQVHSGKRAAALPQGTFQITDAEAEAGARFVVKVFELWKLNDTESCVLLGGLGTRTYARWKKGHIGPMDMDRKMRLSILAGIHKGLKYLFTEKQRGYDWIKKPNAHFDSARPLDILLNGRMTDLMAIRDYLYAIRG